MFDICLYIFIYLFNYCQDHQGRLMRRTILRYVNLAFVLTLTMITPRAKKRFPTLDHLVEAGVCLYENLIGLCHLSFVFFINYCFDFIYL